MAVPFGPIRPIKTPLSLSSINKIDLLSIHPLEAAMDLVADPRAIVPDEAKTAYEVPGQITPPELSRNGQVDLKQPVEPIGLAPPAQNTFGYAWGFLSSLHLNILYQLSTSDCIVPAMRSYVVIAAPFQRLADR